MYKKIKSSDVPKRSRLSVSRFERTAEWKLMEADLRRGLKPSEALQIAFTEEDKAKYRIKNRRTMARFVRKYLAANKMPYSLSSFNRDGSDFIIVKYLPVLKQRA